jgi:hypothetical protein
VREYKLVVIGSGGESFSCLGIAKRLLEKEGRRKTVMPGTPQN